MITGLRTTLWCLVRMREWFLMTWKSVCQPKHISLHHQNSISTESLLFLYKGVSVVGSLLTSEKISSIIQFQTKSWLIRRELTPLCNTPISVCCSPFWTNSVNGKHIIGFNGKHIIGCQVVHHGEDNGKWLAYVQTVGISNTVL